MEVEIKEFIVSAAEKYSTLIYPGSYSSNLTLFLALLLFICFAFIGQMFTKYILRRFSTGAKLMAIEKSSLAALRKKTGYTFSNCKKALELHNNDLAQAEKWLKDQAQNLGWSKATKLEGRQTTQGLIGVLVKDRIAALVEINCETDFVARNEHFQEMVANAAKACVAFTEASSHKGNFIKICMDSEQLRDVKTNDGKTLADHLALMIGKIGENASLTRATMYKTDSEIHLSAYAHPAGSEKNGILLGRFAGVVAFKQNDEIEIKESLSELGKKLCQHIVGMDPKRVGSESDKPMDNVDNENCLIYQDYLLDDSLLVKDVLEESGIEIVDFKRFGCGEQTVSFSGVQPLELIETCQ